MEAQGELLRVGSREKNEDGDEFGVWARESWGKLSSIGYMSDKDCATWC